MSLLDDTQPAPRCPDCGQPSTMVLVGGVQAFCANDDCRVLMWHPQQDPAQAEWEIIDLGGLS